MREPRVPGRTARPDAARHRPGARPRGWWPGRATIVAALAAAFVFDEE